MSSRSRDSSRFKKSRAVQRWKWRKKKARHRAREKRYQRKRAKQ